MDADFDIFAPDGTLLPQDDNSDADGTYEISLPAGRYTVVCEPPVASGLAPQSRQDLLVSGESEVDWVLPPSVRVLGRVLGPGGSPVAATDLDFDRASDGVRQPALGDVTNPFGSFAAYLEAGTYRVSAMPPVGTDLAPAVLPGVPVPTADTLRFDLVPAVHLTGTARDPTGAGVENVRLTFEEIASGNRVPAWGNRTLADGTYRAGIAPGIYRVDVGPPRGSGLVAQRVEPVDLTSDRSLEIDLRSGFRVAGRVLDGAGQPLAGADWDAADQATDAAIPTPNDDTDFDGRYELVLPGGSFRLTLTPPASSGLPPRVFENVPVSADVQLDVNYASQAASALRLVPAVNPVRTAGDFVLELPRDGPTRIEMYDVAGRHVRSLLDAWMPAGIHRLTWDLRDDGGAVQGVGVYYLLARQAEERTTARWVVAP